jgi:NTE family protein
MSKSNLDIKEIKKLVFSAGGNGGYCFIGALDVLEFIFEINGMDIYKIIDGYAGTSIGALISFLLCIGLKSKDILLFFKKNYYKSIKQPLNIHNIIKSFGWLNLSLFKPHLEQLLKKYNFSPKITFKQLYTKTKKILKITVTNLSSNTHAEYHSYNTTPDFIVIDSLIASMSIPGLFTPKYINSQCYVDGAIVDSFPIDQFDRKETLGFDLIRPTGVLDSMENYMLKIFNLMTKRCINISYEKIEIPTYNISRLNPNIENKEKNKLIRSGKQKVCEYFKKDIITHIISIQIIDFFINIIQHYTTSL